MSITRFGSYKIIEEKPVNGNIAAYQLSTLMLDLSNDEDMARSVVFKMAPYFQEVAGTSRNWSFLSAYDHFITPEKFAGLGFVEWVQPDNPEQADISDYCVPIVMAYRQGYSETASEALEEYIFTQAKTQQVLLEVGGLFNDN